jgi:hypothetical protein
MSTLIAVSPIELVRVSESKCEHGELYQIRFFIEDLSGAEYYTQEDGKITWKQVDKIRILKTDFDKLVEKYKDIKLNDIYNTIKDLIKLEGLFNHTDEG